MPGPARKLTVKEEMVLTLLKIRQGLTKVCPANLFGISAALCSRIITVWIKLLAKTLKPLIFWPDRHTVRTMLPQELCKKIS